MGRKATLKDVAQAAGLSESAVSQVLNDRPCRLSEASKQRIRETAQRLGYRANQMARGLAMSRSDAIGLIIPDIENPFFSSFAKRLEHYCNAAGYGLFITDSDDEVSRDCSSLRRLDARGVDGVVYVPSAGIEDPREAGLLDALEGLTAPFVMVDRLLSDVACDKVSVDNRLGARLATEHLIERGHTRIACLANAEGSENGRARLAGFNETLAEHGLDTGAVVPCSYHIEDGYRAADLIPSDATAVFATSDLIAAGVLRRFYERGIRVPEDVSFVSFDNNAAFILCGPGITTVEQDTDALARHALDLLHERIGGSKQPFRELIIEPRLIEKRSVRAI